MIDGLVISGAEPTGEGVRVLVGPIVMSLLMSARDTDQLVGAGPCRVHTQLEIDESGPSLVGFVAEEDRDLYRILREIQGVGPRIALAVTGAGSARDVLRAATVGESAFFMRAPGVGKTRADKLVAHLRDRYAGRLPIAVPAPVATWVEAREALVSAGFTEDQAESALRQVTEGIQAGRRSAEELTEAALSLLARR